VKKEEGKGKTIEIKKERCGERKRK